MPSVEKAAFDGEDRLSTKAQLQVVGRLPPPPDALVTSDAVTHVILSIPTPGLRRYRAASERAGRRFAVLYMLTFYAVEDEWMALAEDERRAGIAEIGQWFAEHEIGRASCRERV